ncbi:PucR family transcriptional regulator [Knoellia sp. p5-6-4]|uniref:PucR family transcriptional regulator n=1 Tax=unclassified Knoellia TaxID=2618719 RepID=UPI0023D9949E|nr:PucR family transcriptional regulator [Knoellia sp. p5-6-4]MDF2143928.1 PucR family transcriptional regulator [Knoellia sp. p5-6-4]
MTDASAVATSGDSGPTLRELLAVDALRLRIHTSPEAALGRAVRWAHSTELPDPSAYLRGGELVCTVGTTLTGVESCARFVDSVVAAGAVGICFGTGDVHDDVPQALVEACRAAGLPLLVAPRGARFSAIGEYLTSRRVEAETAHLRARDELVPRLLAGLRAHAPVVDLLEEAAQLVGGRLELRLHGRTMAAAGAEPTAGDLATDDLPTDDLSTMTASVGGGELVWTGLRERPDPTLVEQLSRVVEVALSERDVEAALERERIGQLLLLVQQRLLNPTALAPFLERAGLGSADIVLSCWPGGAASLLTRRLAPALIGEAPGVSLVVTGGTEQVTAAARELGLACGYGSPVALGHLSQGVSQARAALELASSQGGVVGPSGLLSLEGLLEQQPAARLEPFVDQLVAPLLASDTDRGTEHMSTLRSFLATNGSLQATAREQYLHVNTVRHRLARIRDLTGRDPLVFADRVALAIALWAYDRRDPA